MTMITTFHQNGTDFDNSATGSENSEISQNRINNRDTSETAEERHDLLPCETDDTKSDSDMIRKTLELILLSKWFHIRKNLTQ